MLGHRLVTKQTKKEGLLVESIYVSEKLAYKDEYYLSMTIDRENCCPAIIVSRHGGMDIEAVSSNDPDSVVTLRFDYKAGIADDLVESVATALGITPAEVPEMRALLEKLFVLFKSKDATLLEINPLVRTLEGKFLCLDAKFTFDNAAAPRQKDLFALAETSERDASEVEAEESGLVYVRLDGNIGNVVNGAGLAMATNDAISFYGGKSANFLDAGGQATKETMVDAFRIILKDDRVKVILVNIYGGKQTRSSSHPYSLILSQVSYVVI
jgi:succinyl-CoA synthetase beta subunit